jgi:predicted ATPase/DNA-binding winged helix-turn-helix (wHTH) protein
MTRYVFGVHPAFELRSRERILLRDGQAVALGSRALDVLLVLLQNAGQVVSRQELLDRVWPGLPVEDNNLNVHVSTLRRILGARAIVTVAGRGYCFARVPRVGHDPEDARSAPRLKTNLPACLPTLLGRETELDELQALVQSHPLVTVLGAGGIGKTLLVQHLLRRLESQFQHGVCFVELASLSRAEALPDAVAAALQVQPAGPAGLNDLVRSLASLHMLLVLDNVEHLPDAAAEMVLALLGTCPTLKVLVTSQAPLRLDSEHLYRLGPLSFPDAALTATEALRYAAVALFVDRARAADARFALNDSNAAAAVHLCRALDGLPLAIELAAWRAPVLGVRCLADSLHDPLKLLAAPRIGAPDRLHTLRNALAWSYSLLTPAQQTLLRRMSVLRGTSDLELVQAVAEDLHPTGKGDEDGFVQTLTTLVDRSLVAVVPEQDAGVRYRLLEAPRAFAREQLELAQETSSAGWQHAHAVSARFARAYEEYLNEQESRDDWARRYLPDTDNGYAAMIWLSRHDATLALLALLPGLMLATAREERQRRREMAECGARVALSADDAGRWALWTLLESTLAQMLLDVHGALELASRSVVRARESLAREPDSRWLYRALCQLAVVHLCQSDRTAGEQCLAEARALEQAQWPALLRRQRWIAEIWQADRRGDGEAMYQANLRLRSLSPEDGAWNWASGLNMINAAMAGGRAEEAVRHGLRIVAQLEATRHVAGLVETRVQLVGALIACQRLDEARQHSRACWPMVAHHNRINVWADYQALLALLEGRIADAAQLLGYANAQYRRHHLERTHNEARAVARTMDALRRISSPTEMAQWIEQGETLELHDVEALAFSSNTSAS